MPDITSTALAPPQVPRNLRPEFGRPAPNGFIGHVDATFEQHFLNLTQAQIEPHI